MVPPAPPRLSMTNCAPTSRRASETEPAHGVGAAGRRIGDHHLDRSGRIGGLAGSGGSSDDERRTGRSRQHLPPRQSPETHDSLRFTDLILPDFVIQLLQMPYNTYKLYLNAPMGEHHAKGRAYTGTTTC